jgi:hypothetical protein
MNTKPKIISCEKGPAGQWIITAEVAGCFIKRQYYGYTKRQAMTEARAALKQGEFDF